MKLIIGIGIIAVFTVIGFISLMGSKIDYADFNTAKSKPGKEFQIKGEWLKDMESKSGTEFEFYMKDVNNIVMKVIYNKPKPDNIEHAESVVVRGKVRNDIFFASHILTKCPSKYTGQDDSNISY
ncbi:MAG: cytochrome c maturation protein CcmE [Ignavibacteria bacterium]|nr:cytochrome c maturation protein CcmE [Ignavibacteria bacterium]